MKSLLLLISFLFCFQIQADAQFGKLKDKLAEKLMKKEKPAKDEQEAESEEDVEESEPAFDVSSMFGGGDVELEESYDYDFSIDWLVETEDADKPTEMKQFFSSEENYFGMEVKGEEKKKARIMNMIIDFERQYFITIDQKEKQAIVMAMPDDMQDQIDERIDEENEKMAKGKLTKTGKTKVIAGYTCEQYIYEGEDGKGEIWITKDLKYKNYNMFNYMQRKPKQQKANNPWYSMMEDGFMLEVKGEDEDGKPFAMTATEVNEKADISFKMADFEVMNLTNMPKGFGGQGRRN